MVMVSWLWFVRSSHLPGKSVSEDLNCVNTYYRVTDVHAAAVGKADTAAGLVAQQSTDVSSNQLSAQPAAQLAASYNIGIITSFHFHFGLTSSVYF